MIPTIKLAKEDYPVRCELGHVILNNHVVFRKEALSLIPKSIDIPISAGVSFEAKSASNIAFDHTTYAKEEATYTKMLQYSSCSVDKLTVTNILLGNCLDSNNNNALYRRLTRANGDIVYIANRFTPIATFYTCYTVGRMSPIYFLLDDEVMGVFMPIEPNTPEVNGLT